MKLGKKRLSISQPLPFLRLQRSREEGWVRPPAHRKRRRGDLVFLGVIVLLALAGAWVALWGGVAAM